MAIFIRDVKKQQHLGASAVTPSGSSGLPTVGSASPEPSPADPSRAGAQAIAAKLRELGVEPVIILHREQDAGAGDTYDEDFDPYHDYAVIAKDEALLDEEEAMRAWYKWLRDSGIEVLTFDIDRCTSVEGLLEQMAVRDGAKIVLDFRQP